LLFEVSERLSDGFGEIFECSHGGLPQRCFELGERLFDRIEVGAIGRQIAQRCASLLDRFLDASDFVGWQVVHDDDIAPAQGGRVKMFDVGEETRAVHRKGAAIASQRKAPTKVIAIQWPCGADATRRRPRGARP
jgi:hypothetical protein